MTPSRRKPAFRATFAVVFFLSAFAVLIEPRPAAAQLLSDPSVRDVTACSVTTVEIARTPFSVRRQEQIPASSSVLTLDGVFDGVPAGETFHVTDVTGIVFSNSGQVFHVRLYQDGIIVWAANVDGITFHSPGSAIYERTLNQPTDLYFRSDSLGQYDLQIARSGNIGIANAIVTFWGYLTGATCDIRPQ